MCREQKRESFKQRWRTRTGRGEERKATTTTLLSFSVSANVGVLLACISNCTKEESTWEIVEAWERARPRTSMISWENLKILQARAWGKESASAGVIWIHNNACCPWQLGFRWGMIIMSPLPLIFPRNLIPPQVLPPGWVRFDKVDSLICRNDGC